MKTKKVLYIGLVIGLVSLFNGCVRKDVSDPTPGGQSAQRLYIEGWANPPTIFIPESQVPQVVTITVRVNSFEQLSLAGRTVIFQQTEADGATVMSWGYFEGAQLAITKTLDSQGYCQVNYSFPGQYTVAADTKIYIKVTLADMETMRIPVYDLIPVFLKIVER